MEIIDLYWNTVNYILADPAQLLLLIFISISIADLYRYILMELLRDELFIKMSIKEKLVMIIPFFGLTIGATSTGILVTGSIAYTVDKRLGVIEPINIHSVLMMAIFAGLCIFHVNKVKPQSIISNSIIGLLFGFRENITVSDGSKLEDLRLCKLIPLSKAYGNLKQKENIVILSTIDTLIICNGTDIDWLCNLIKFIEHPESDEIPSDEHICHWCHSKKQCYELEDEQYVGGRIGIFYSDVVLCPDCSEQIIEKLTNEGVIHKSDIVVSVI